MVNSVKDFRGKIEPPVEKGVLKIEGYAQRLTQGYSAYGGSYLWAPGCTKWLRRQELTCRFRLSMGHFCWAAGKIFTQHNTRCQLEDHCSFGSKFNVPVGFLSLRS